MPKKTTFILPSCLLTATAGIYNIANSDAQTATGVGLFNIAASTALQNLNSKPKLKKFLAAAFLASNLIPTAIGIANIVAPQNHTSAGLGQIALGIASSIQCLDALGAFKNDK